MNILVAPDSFKGTFTAPEAAALITSGICQQGATAVRLPLGDGGEGTSAILASVIGAEWCEIQTCGPWRHPLKASYALTPDGTAFLDLAAASGITAPSPEVRDAVTADTYGTGLLIAHALRRGARSIVVAAGGSATTDGGAGAIYAIEEHGGAGGARFTVLTDVTTVFEDAPSVFGPQKGARPDQVRGLTQRMHSLAAGLPKDPRGVPGTGAAGGFSGGMWAKYGATLVPGGDYVLDQLDFDRHAGDADAIVVGEGRLDSQTGQGKIISAVLARNQGKPVYAVVGSVAADLGDYVENFAGILVASTAYALKTAGREVARRASRAAAPL